MASISDQIFGTLNNFIDKGVPALLDGGRTPSTVAGQNAATYPEKSAPVDDVRNPSGALAGQNSAGIGAYLTPKNMLIAGTAIVVGIFVLKKVL